MSTADKNTLTILRFMIERDETGGLFFRIAEDGRITIDINCSDLFAWACADSEEITVDDLPDFQRAIDDTKALGGTEYIYADSLWACRKVNMQPQPPVMAKMSPALRALFEALPANPAAKTKETVASVE